MVCGPGHLAVGETVILLHPLLPLVVVSIGMEKECLQNDSLANGYGHRLGADAAGQCRVVRGAGRVAAGAEVPGGAGLHIISKNTVNAIKHKNAERNRECGSAKQKTQNETHLAAAVTRRRPGDRLVAGRAAVRGDRGARVGAVAGLEVAVSARVAGAVCVRAAFMELLAGRAGGVAVRRAAVSVLGVRELAVRARVARRVRKL